jgi:uncharacterized protein YndB with AHSA1/START domain
VIAASQRELWELVRDPYHMPRWWPGVERVEDVGEDRFTQVFKTARGRPVRADYRLIDSREPWLLAWEQDVAGTPFARVLAELVVELRLEPSGDGTAVTIAEMAKLRGYSRTGGMMMRRATGRRLQRALAGIEQIAG